MKKRNRVYVDTSVLGGVDDEEFKDDTLRFFEEVKGGKHVVIVSEITARELKGAPASVIEFVAALPRHCIENLTFNDEMLELREAYLSAKVLGRRWSDDAGHVAAATVTRADLIVSWNFKHLVKWEKIRAFNSVNLSLGYPMMTILSPKEVVTDEEDV